MAHDNNAVWTQIDPASLGSEAQAAYENYKSLYRQAKSARQAFEAMVSDSAALDAGKRLVFGYNFGKLSIAIVDDDRKAKAPSKAPVSLSGFLAASEARGEAH